MANPNSRVICKIRKRLILNFIALMSLAIECRAGVVDFEYNWSSEVSTYYVVEYDIGDFDDGSESKTSFKTLRDGVKESLRSSQVSLLGSVRVAAEAHGELKYVSGGTELNLGLDISGNVNTFAEFEYLNMAATARATSGMRDVMHLRGDGTIPIIEGGDGTPKVKMLFDFDGVYQSGGPPSVTGYISAVAKSGATTASATYFLADGLSGPIIHKPGRFSGALELTAILGPGRSSTFDFSLSAFGGTTAGFFRINANNTMRLIGVEFLDGTTPEEHGFTVEFDSGLTSPNSVLHGPHVTTVPEPASLTLFAFGALGMLCGAVRSRGR